MPWNRALHSPTRCEQECMLVLWHSPLCLHGGLWWSIVDITKLIQGKTTFEEKIAKNFLEWKRWALG
jgi:hypothetical protein